MPLLATEKLPGSHQQLQLALPRPQEQQRNASLFQNNRSLGRTDQVGRQSPQIRLMAHQGQALKPGMGHGHPLKLRHQGQRITPWRQGGINPEGG